MATYLDPRFKGNKRGDLDAILEMEVTQIIDEKANNETTTPQAAVSAGKEIRKSALEELFAEDDIYVVNNAQDEIRKLK